MTDRVPDVDHHVRIPVGGGDAQTMSDFITATSDAILAGVPTTARITVDRGQRDRTPVALHFDWTTPADMTVARSRPRRAVDALLRVVGRG